MAYPLRQVRSTTHSNQVRLQTQPHDAPRKNMAAMFVHIVKSDGVPGLYRGVCFILRICIKANAEYSEIQLTASLLRQITYSTTRFGVYEELKEVFTTATSKPSFPALIAMASTSGFLGGIAGNPADIMNVRMQNDASLPAAQRRNYKNAIEGLIRMTREEGFKSLFRGVWPNSTRAVLMTASQLASYDIFKKELLDRTSMGDSLYTHFSASFMAGFVATIVCSPVDVIKTRVMSAHTHDGLWTLVAKITKNEGLGWMFRGWVPSFIRLGPHTIATFMFLEQHKTLYRKWKGLE